MIFPLAVRRKRLCAPRLVFIFGIFLLLPLFPIRPRAEYHRDDPSHTDRRSLYDGDLGELLDDPVQEFLAKIYMLHLPATENNGEFYLVLLFEKLFRMPLLELEIVLLDLRPELDLLQLRKMLLFLRFASSLALLVLVLPVIHYVADRWPNVRCELDQIEIAFLGYLHSIRSGHDAELVPFVIDNSYLRYTDHPVDTYPFFSLPDSFTS